MSDWVDYSSNTILPWMKWSTSLGILGMPVIESKNVPPGQILTFDALNGGQKTVMVNDIWRDLQWPLFLQHQRSMGKHHLALVVAKAEKRLFG
jgi:hypothetical protein